jgi:hypothetical protein
MNANTSNKLSKGFYRVAFAVAAIGIAAAGPAIQAKPNPNKGEDKPANVIAHVQLSGGPVTRMLLVKKEGKEYLLIGLDSTAGVAVFDVSNPDRPRTIDTSSSATGAPSAEVKVVADTLTLFGSSDAGTPERQGPRPHLRHQWRWPVDRQVKAKSRGRSDRR